MGAPQSLAEFLGVVDPKQPERLTSPSLADAAEHLTGKQFCDAVVESREFKQYIVNGLVVGDLAPAILCRIVDHAWGKPPDRVEHTGKDGKPIETITEVRRVVVRVHSADVESFEGPIEKKSGSVH